MEKAADDAHTPEASDDDLIGQFRRGTDPAALNQLLERYLKPVRNLMMQMVGNPADADDLTQETMVRIYRNLPSFAGRSQFSTWVYSIALNTARTFLKRRSRQAAEPLGPDVDPPAPTHQAPCERAGGRELDGRIAAALDALSPALRAAIVLTIMQGLPVAAAARLEGCCEATMYWRVFQARRRLRRDLAEFLEP